MQYPANYDHRISWMEYEPWLDMFVSKSFRTVADAVPLHVASLRKREYDGAGNQNITRIRVEKIFQGVEE